MPIDVRITVLAHDASMPALRPCACGAEAVEYGLGLMFYVECERAAVCARSTRVTCSTRVGAIGRWNRHSKIIDTLLNRKGKVT